MGDAALAYQYEEDLVYNTNEGGFAFTFIQPLKVRKEKQKFVFPLPSLRKPTSVQFSSNAQVVFSRLQQKKVAAERRIRDLAENDDYALHDMLKPSAKVIAHAVNLVRLCDDDDIFSDVRVSAGGNGTVLLSWRRESLLATVDVGEDDFTYVVIDRYSYDELGGGECDEQHDYAISDFYRLMK